MLKFDTMLIQGSNCDMLYYCLNAQVVPGPSDEAGAIVLAISTPEYEANPCANPNQDYFYGIAYNRDYVVAADQIEKYRSSRLVSREGRKEEEETDSETGFETGSKPVHSRIIQMIQKYNRQFMMNVEGRLADFEQEL